MNVLFITRKWPPAVGGMETYSVKLVEKLKNIVDLTTCYLPGKHNGGPPGLLELFFFFIKSTIVCLKKSKFHVVHLGDMVLWPVGLISLFFKRKTSVVISAHGTDIAYPLRPGVLPYLYKLYLRIGALLIGKKIKIIANSHATAEHCLSHGYKEVCIVPLAVTISDSFSNVNNEIGDYVLFVGRLVHRKGAAWFIENVLPLLKGDINFKIAGTIWDNDEFEAVVQCGRAEFLGPVYGERLAQLRRHAIAVVMPNISCGGRDFEGFGITALEAGADGGVLLASGIEGIVDAVIDGETGFLLPSEQPFKWKEKIEEVHKWPIGKRLQFIENARLVLKDKFSWDRVASNTYKVYLNEGK